MEENKTNSRSEKMKEYWKKKKEAIARANVLPIQRNTEVVKVVTPAEPNYKKLYTAATEELKACKTKINQYENLIKSYAEAAQNADNKLKKATLEYNARIKFMLDSVRHAYTSMQLAADASSEKGGN